MKQAVAYLNFCLQQYRYPNMSRQPELWRDTLNFYKSIQKESRWRNYVSTKKAKSLTVEECKQIAKAPIRRHGVIQLDWLRDKVAANTFIHMGYHPKDAYFMTSESLHDEPHNCDHQGNSKPRFKVTNEKTKDKSKLIRNWIACGCEEDHNPNNDMCEYALMKHLLKELPEDRAKIRLWWNVSSNNTWNRRGKKG